MGADTVVSVQMDVSWVLHYTFSSRTLGNTYSTSTPIFLPMPCLPVPPDRNHCHCLVSPLWPITYYLTYNLILLKTRNKLICEIPLGWRYPNNSVVLLCLHLDEGEAEIFGNDDADAHSLSLVSECSITSAIALWYWSICVCMLTEWMLCCLHSYWHKQTLYWVMAKRNPICFLFTTSHACPVCVNGRLICIFKPASMHRDYIWNRQKICPEFVFLEKNLVSINTRVRVAWVLLAITHLCVRNFLQMPNV